MQFVMGLIGAVLVALMLAQLDSPDQTRWVLIYATGAVLALTTLLRGLGIWTVRFFAVATTVAMFVYFAGFFMLTPHLPPDWWARDAAREAAGLLVSGFAMIPVLSVWSCRMKAGLLQVTEQSESSDVNSEMDNRNRNRVAIPARPPGH